MLHDAYSHLQETRPLIELIFAPDRFFWFKVDLEVRTGSILNFIQLQNCPQAVVNFL